MTTSGNRGTEKREAVLQRSKMADQVLKCLMDWIMDGTLQMGDKLRTEQISAELGVSRMPVREALSILERKGIAVSEPYVGMHLVNLERDEIAEIYSLRQMLESQAAYTACRNISLSALEQIKRLHQEYREILMAPVLNAKSIHLKNREFHFAIYQASGLHRTCGMIESLWDILSFFKMLYGETLLETAEGKRKMLMEHQSYIDYLEQGKAAELRSATRRNISNKWKRYERAISDGGKKEDSEE